MFTTWRIVRPFQARLAPFARFVVHGGDRVFKGVGGRSNEPTKMRRAEKKKSHARANMCQIYDLIG